MMWHESRIRRVSVVIRNQIYPNNSFASRATLSISSRSSKNSGSSSSSCSRRRNYVQSADTGFHAGNAVITATAMQFMDHIHQSFRVFTYQLFLQFCYALRAENRAAFAAYPAPDRFYRRLALTPVASRVWYSDDDRFNSERPQRCARAGFVA